MRLAALELGGTHALLALADTFEVHERAAFRVGSSEETLPRIAAQLSAWNAMQPIDTLGIAAFGPIRVDPLDDDFGRTLPTPKPGWTGADVAGSLRAAVSGPVALHTDVTAAALAEGRWGAAQGCTDHAYITVGTGVGIGIIAGGHPLVGAMHPEGGHLRVRRPADDDFAGTCPFHGDCLEGLICGPALSVRCSGDPAALSDDDSAWTFVIDALAEACSTLLLVLATQRIVIGGGVLRQRPAIVKAIARRAAEKLGGYLPLVDDLAPIVPASLEHAGLHGALILAHDSYLKGLANLSDR